MKQALGAILLVIGLCLRAQQAPESPDGSGVQEVIENVALQTESETFDYDGFIDELAFLKKHPVNLNRTTAEELSQIPFLTAAQISSLLGHIALQGKFISVYELQAVSGFDLATINLLLPYIRVQAFDQDFSVAARKLFTKGNVVLVGRYRQVPEKSIGYSRTDGKGYLGSPAALFLRFRYTFGSRLSYGFTAEKDAGEQFFKGTNKQGFDYYSGHFFMRQLGVVRALALGDFEVRLGQGLIMWSGFGFRKSPMVLNVMREAPRLRPYTSLNEFNFLRGGAVTLGLRGFECTVFAAFNQLDANLVQSPDTALNAEEAFSAFNESGFHRTAAETADRNTVNRFVSGGNFSYRAKRWQVGVNALYTRFFTSYSRRLYPYNQFDFNRSTLLNASADYRFSFRNVHLFGEVAMSDNLGFGLVNGALVSVDPKVDFSIVHRYYSRDFHTLFANAFAESARPQNENGVYLGVSVRPVRMVRLDGYFDLYMSRWLKFLTDAPSWGSDNFFQATITPGKRLETYVRYRFELKKKNASDDSSPLDYLVNELRQNVRFNLKYKISESVTLSNRIEWSYFQSGNLKAENGFIVYQDVGFKKLGFPLSANARLGIFRTAGYNSRIFTYESDVLYAFSIPALYGNGMRYYLTLNYDITRNIEVWFRFSQTQRFDTKTIGSGLDAVDKNYRSEIKAQFRLKF